jgi:protein phosphatase
MVERLIDCHGATGRRGRRDASEDPFLITDLTRLVRVEQGGVRRADHGYPIGATQAKLLVVADGMGEGRTSLASSTALRAVVGYVNDVLLWLSGPDQRHEEDLRRELRAVLERCQVRIQQAATRRPGHPCLATSLTMAVVLLPRAYVVHAGASRCYLLRRLALRRVTKDQTFAQRLADHGVLTTKEAEASSWQNLLWSAIGSGPGLTPEVYGLTLQTGDVLLLCSGGLARHLPEPVIALTLLAAASARQACDWLVALAQEGSGAPNMTALAARFG